MHLNEDIFNEIIIHSIEFQARVFQLTHKWDGILIHECIT